MAYVTTVKKQKSLEADTLCRDINDKQPHYIRHRDISLLFYYNATLRQDGDIYQMTDDQSRPRI